MGFEALKYGISKGGMHFKIMQFEKINTIIIFPKSKFENNETGVYTIGWYIITQILVTHSIIIQAFEK